MKNLFKYELRKSIFSKLMILGITVVFEVIFLAGLYGRYFETMGIAIFGLIMIALCGTAFIGVESIFTLYRDLNTKQSYMLFMTPNSSYKILGAKTLENTFAVLFSGAFFGALAYIDISLLIKEEKEIGSLFEMAQDYLKSFDPRMVVNARTIFVVVLLLLCSWILMIVTAYFAIVLTCTFLSGKKGAAIISFGVYIVISMAISYLQNLVPDFSDVYMKSILQSVISLVFTIIMYFVTAWIMDKKLSV